MSAVLAQLDLLRKHLGPKSNVQISDGEVTLRPAAELIEILRYARSIGIVPMVMTHGENFRRQPGLLDSGRRALDAAQSRRVFADQLPAARAGGAHGAVNGGGVREAFYKSLDKQ